MTPRSDQVSLKCEHISKVPWSLDVQPEKLEVIKTIQIPIYVIVFEEHPEHLARFCIQCSDLPSFQCVS